MQTNFGLLFCRERRRLNGFVWGGVRCVCIRVLIFCLFVTLSGLSVNDFSLSLYPYLSVPLSVFFLSLALALSLSLSLYLSLSLSLSLSLLSLSLSLSLSRALSLSLSLSISCALALSLSLSLVLSFLVCRSSSVSFCLCSWVSLTSAFSLWLSFSVYLFLVCLCLLSICLYLSLFLFLALFVSVCLSLVSVSLFTLSLFSSSSFTITPCSSSFFWYCCPLLAVLGYVSLSVVLFIGLWLYILSLRGFLAWLCFGVLSKIVLRCSTFWWLWQFWGSHQVHVATIRFWKECLTGTLSLQFLRVWPLCFCAKYLKHPENRCCRFFWLVRFWWNLCIICLPSTGLHMRLARGPLQGAFFFWNVGGPQVHLGRWTSC